MNDIRYPIALHEPSGSLINILDADHGKNSKCICFKCRECLVAINKEQNKQKPHFRHHHGSNCNFSYESYIHWLAKEVFKTAEQFVIPEITSKMIYEYSDREFIDKIYTLFKKIQGAKAF